MKEFYNVTLSAPAKGLYGSSHWYATILYKQDGQIFGLPVTRILSAKSARILNRIEEKAVYAPEQACNKFDSKSDLIAAIKEAIVENEISGFYLTSIQKTLELPL